MADDQSPPAGPDLALGVSPGDLENDMLLGHVGQADVLLVRVGSEIYAIDAHCSHYHGPLADGLVTGHDIRCPWHHACFDLRTGEAVHAPALSPLSVWKVEQQGRKTPFDGYADVVTKRKGADGLVYGWHGTRTENLMGICKTGLVTPKNLPKGVHVTVGPPVPTGLIAASVSPTQVNVSWNASAGATQYEVFRRSATSGGAFTSLTTTAMTSISDMAVSASNAYAYKVRAINASASMECGQTILSVLLQHSPQTHSRVDVNLIL